MTDQKTILITDDDPAFVEALARRCANLGLQVKTATDGLEAMMLVAKQPPDLLLLDINMPVVDGLSVCEKLTQDPRIPPLAVVMLTGSSDEHTVLRCRSLGAHYVLKDTRTWSKLEPLISGILDLDSGPDGTASRKPAAKAPAGRRPAAEASAARVPKILVVDDDREITKAICMRLRACGLDVLRASNGMQGYWRTIKNQPDAIITDYMMPEGSGERFLIRLKENSATKNIPVIVLTGRKFDGRTDHALRRDVLGPMGAVALFTKPYEFQELLAELKRHVTIPAST